MSSADNPSSIPTPTSAAYAPTKSQTRCCAPEIVAPTGSSWCWAHSSLTSITSVASSVTASARSRLPSKLLADHRQLFDPGDQPVQHPLKVPACRIVEATCLPDGGHGWVTVPIEIGLPEAGPGIPVGLGGDPGVPRLVCVADHGAGCAKQLPLDQVGDGDVFRTREAACQQRGIKRFGNIEDMRTDRKSRHVVVEQPRVRAVDPPRLPRPLLEALLPGQLRIG